MSNEGKYFGRLVFLPSSRFSGAQRTSAKGHWSFSNNMWCLNTLLGHFMIAFTLSAFVSESYLNLLCATETRVHKKMANTRESSLLQLKTNKTVIICHADSDVRTWISNTAMLPTNKKWHDKKIHILKICSEIKFASFAVTKCHLAFTSILHCDLWPLTPSPCLLGPQQWFIPLTYQQLCWGLWTECGLLFAVTNR